MRIVFSLNIQFPDTISRLFTIFLLAVFFFAPSLLAQVGWTFDHGSEVLTVASDGSIQTGGDSSAFSLAGNGNVNISSEGVSFIVSEGLDVLVNRSTPTDLSLFRIVTKRPASLSAADLAGSWVYKEFKIEEDAGGAGIYGFATVSSNVTVTSGGGFSLSGSPSGTFTIDANKHMLLSINGELWEFGVNASKDLMVSISTSETGVHLLRILTRPESGGTTSQLAGAWTIRDIEVDTTPGVYDLWNDTEDITISTGGSFSTEDGPATLTANGNGGATYSYSEGTLTWNQSRNLFT